MKNFLFTLCYDGTNYHGWQVQQNALSVQQVFQDALESVLGIRPDVKGCSRTDSGVHARQYAINSVFDHPIAPQRLQLALNHFLPKDMAVQKVQEVPLDFHARYDCIGKEYVYQIWNHPVRDPFLEGYALHYWYPLPLEALQQAASHYLGTHDFTSFCTLDSRDKGDLCRTVTKAEVEKQGNLVTFTVAADGFLYNMVRIMVGTLLRVAQGKFAPEDIPKIIAGKDRTLAGPTAPGHGLFLQQVFYKGGITL